MVTGCLNGHMGEVTTPEEITVTEVKRMVGLLCSIAYLVEQICMLHLKLPEKSLEQAMAMSRLQN